MSMEFLKTLLMRRYNFIKYVLRLLITCGVIFAVRIFADIVRETQGGGISAQFIVVNKGRLYGKLLMYLENHEHSKCSEMCTHHRQCVTINYNAEQKICELLADEFVEYEAIDEPGWFNYGTPTRVNGGYSSWGHGPCSVTCGHGVKVAWRTCTNPVPKYGGQYCDGIERKTLTCHEKHCPINGGWSLWRKEGVCSATCGYGTQVMKRTCTQPVPKHNGSSCHGNDTMAETCLYCQLSDLSSQKTCTASGYVEGSLPGNAVDGLTDSWFKSNYYGDTWWSVDFAEAVLIQYINVYANYPHIGSQTISLDTERSDKRISCFQYRNPWIFIAYRVECKDEASVCSKLIISTQTVFNLHEVNVYGYYLKDRVDVAKGKEAHQSSTEGSHVANYANDNDETTYSTTLDNEGTPPWWHIDLKMLIVLHKINFYLYDGGNDYAKYNDLIIYTREIISTEWSLYENEILASTSKFTEMKYLQRKEARFINVTLTRNAKLSIREIRVRGFPKNP